VVAAGAEVAAAAAGAVVGAAAGGVVGLAAGAAVGAAGADGPQAAISDVIATTGALIRRNRRRLNGIANLQGA
jgi:hypothetical protein